MKRWCAVLLMLAVCAVPAQAHFVWIVPLKGAEALSAQVIFSDDLEPDRSVPIKKIEQTELFVLGARKATPLKKTTVEGKNAYQVTVPGKGPAVIAGVLRYGVIQRGKAEPFRLTYYAKALVGGTLQEAPAEFWKPTRLLPLDIVLIEGKSKARVLWEGQPVAGAEVSLLVPGQKESVERTTDKDGTFALERPTAAGLYAIRANRVEAKGGEEGGKKYKESRYYTTLTFAVRAAGGGGAGAGEQARAGGAKVPPADPVATKLLRDARAARATWKDFPGFIADLEVNHGGKTVKGKFEVSADGKVKVELSDANLKAWAQRQLRSVVDHRIDNSAERDTPCAFVDDNTDHPLGRAIRVLNDELHSGYRIRDRQIIEVNRQMQDFRFTITVLENQVTAEKKFLPVSYVVNTWDLKSGALRSSAAFHDTWQRVGAFDLPATILVVTGTAPSALDARTIRLSNHKLLR
ncbi:MAG: DUF3386 family protein [Gemmataceae bacterium]|nr:DUF3386 family protein [Gemmataceae bacterium]